jgi:hypothetical protein
MPDKVLLFEYSVFAVSLVLSVFAYAILFRKLKTARFLGWPDYGVASLLVLMYSCHFAFHGYLLLWHPREYGFHDIFGFIFAFTGPVAYVRLLRPRAVADIAS